mmetsp:Transcript_28150/g.56603  ORF Transcript_28150/g.56603 Transcript_28150/m.56603 type:complete len:334 (+) Transcript_28150:70-1071(+)|eukprot:scaffold650_cov127-Skeletonema_marinoi.AAC.10
MANSNKFKSDDVPALPPPPLPLPEVAGVEEDFSTSLERLRNEVQQAKAIPEESARETALLSALKNCRKCLEDAEEAKVIATRRVTAAKEVYENAAQALSGYTPLNSRVAGIGNSSNKRAKIEKMPRVSVAQLAEDASYPTNSLYLPPSYSQGGSMDEGLVSNFRDSFYRQLTGGAVQSAADLDGFVPPPTNANLKSKAQLKEWIYIAEHWATGVDGLDAGQFRAKHKTWYSRMKPVTYKLGRRTGIHIRETDDGTKYLCRHSKDGSKSIIYLEIGQVFDALFEMHVMELGHRGRDATKNLADERYANLPDAQIRAFLDACPACAARRTARAFS